MQRGKFVLGGVVIAVGLVLLFISGVKQSGARHVMLYELVQGLESDLADERVQLAGCRVVDGSIQWDRYHHRPSFTVSDGEHSVLVEYSGNAVLPDSFKDEAQVVLEGRFVTDRQVFDAEVVFAKCPSKYEGKSYDDHVAVTEGASM